MQKRNRFFSFSLRESFLGSGILFLIDRLVRLFSFGMFGSFFLSDTRTDQALEESAATGALEVAQVHSKVTLPLKRRLLADAEHSKILQAFRSIFDALLSTPAKSFGFFFFSAGFFTIAFSTVTHFYESVDPQFFEKLTVGTVCVLLSFPLFNNNAPIHSAIQNSDILAFFFYHLFGIAKVERTPKVFAFQEYLALLFGLAFSCLLSFFDYELILLVSILLLFAAFTFIRPETGTLVCLFLLLLVPAKYLAILLAITLLSFLFKFFTGKRTLRFTMLDISIVAFLALLLSATCIGIAGFLPNHFFAILLFGNIAFLIANLFTNAEWLERCVSALLFGVFFVAAIGCVQFFTGNASTAWQDQTLFADLSGRVGSTLGNPNMLATSLTLFLPLSYVGAIAKQWSASGRKIARMCCIASTLCLIFTWSRGGWLGALVACIIFCLLYTRKTFFFLLCGAALSPLLTLALPDMVVRRILSIFNLADTSISYRLSIWRQSIDMMSDHLFFGFGYGEESFTQMVQYYPISGITSEAHAHSLYFQLVLSCGIFGLLLFVIFLTLLARKLFTFHNHYRGAVTAFPYRMFASATFSGICGVLVQSFTDHTWYSYRVFCAFWVTVGLTIACIRACKRLILAPMDESGAFTIDLL